MPKYLMFVRLLDSGRLFRLDDYRPVRWRRRPRRLPRECQSKTEFKQVRTAKSEQITTPSRRRRRVASKTQEIGRAHV